jgi:hypothetical protein
VEINRALIRRRIERWRALPASERRLILRLLILLPLIGLGLRLLGYKNFLDLLARYYPRGLAKHPIDRATVEMASRMAALTAISANCGPYRATCLHKSLALWCLLRRRGIPAELCIGVRKSECQLEAHAWVELEGKALNEMISEGSPFVTIHRIEPIKGSVTL